MLNYGKSLSGENLTPREIVAELDKYIIGQKKAKRAVAIALRNRWRRMRVESELRDEIAPKNIIMIGPTGVGKTEIARRLAKIAGAPFVKVEATKFTEVGYVGKDVESMIRELTGIAESMVREREKKKVREKAKRRAKERVAEILYRKKKKEESRQAQNSGDFNFSYSKVSVLQGLERGEFDNELIEIEAPVKAPPMVEVFAGSSMESIEMNIKEMMENLFSGRQGRRSLTVKDALEVIEEEETYKLIDSQKISMEAVSLVENSGIVFIDEIDKVASKGTAHSIDVSREGVQRDILPIVEGTTVNTKYGMVKTDHILFIAAGAFHMSKPSDLLPELQGRFPIRVELDSLSEEDFYRILTEPNNALVKQYRSLIGTEGVELKFTEEALKEIANFAFLVNSRTENIGARRLHTVMERVVEEVSFEAPYLKGKEIVIDDEYVRKRIEDVVKDRDLSRYIL